MMQSSHDHDHDMFKAQLGGGDKLTSKYDLVEQVHYLYVRVVKARDLPTKDVTGRCDPYAEVRLGNYKGTTRHLKRKYHPEWNQVFVFIKDRIQGSMLEISVKDNYLVNDDFMGWVLFDLSVVSKDGPLASQWFKLRDRKGNMSMGEMMLNVWWVTQADEAFPESWHSDVTSFGRVRDGHANVRSKVYHSPNLWYLRVNVIEAQDLIPSDDTTKIPELLVKATLGYQVLRTKVDTSRSMNPIWNEELMFVAEEPFEEPLILSVEDRYAPYDNKVVGMCAIHLLSVERRLDNKPINTRWINLKKDVIADGEFGSRLLIEICLEGGYHVFDKSTQYSSDFRPISEKLWKKSIGILEVGIFGACGILPMKMHNDGKAKTDAYCVAKYGKKWAKTRTIIDSLAPKWNEQYNWPVFDPCTVITIGVFDNCNLEGGDARNSSIGKVRIRLSTLQTGCIYSHSYPLLVLHSSGVKRWESFI